MSLKHLRTLKAIAHQGSFAAAGDKLGLTQAAISQQISQLEQSLGVQLFDKVGRNQTLNHDGRIVLARAEQILSLYDQLNQGLGKTGQFTGELLIGAVFSVQTGSLGPVLASLRDLYPQLKIKVFGGMSDELMTRVENNKLDAVLITEPLHSFSSQYQWHTLDNEPFYVIAPPSQHADSDTALLHNQPFIRLDPLAFAGTLIDNELRRREITPIEVMEFDSLQAGLMMVEQQLGVTIMAFGDKMHRYYNARFTMVPFGNPVLKRNIGVYQRKEHSRKELVDVLIQQYESYLQQ